MFLYNSSDTNLDANNHRVFTEDQEVNVTSWTTAAYCQDTNSPPLEEYHMIVKKGIGIQRYTAGKHNLMKYQKVP